MSNSWLNTLITWLLTTLKKVMFRKPKHDSHCIAISTETKNVSLFENSCFEITKQNCVSALMAKIFTATSDKYVITFLSLISLFWCLDRPRWLDIVLFQYSFGIVINSFRFFRKNNWTIIKLLYKTVSIRMKILVRNLSKLSKYSKYSKCNYACTSAEFKGIK